MIDLIIDKDWLPDSGMNLLIWSTKDKAKESHFFKDTTQAWEHAKKMSTNGMDVYFGLGLSDKEIKTTNKRFKADEISAITALWMDIDYGLKDSGKKYAETPEETMSLIKQIFLQPSLIVDSGGGFHAYWILKEPWVFEDKNERSAAHKLCLAWQNMVRSVWRKAGYTVDSTADLSRVLRVPGTINYKYNKEVQVYSSSEYRYNPSDFEQFLGSSTEEEPITAIPLPEINVDMPLTTEEITKFMLKFTTLMSEDDAFRKTFEKRRRNMNDNSLSGYDAALARRGVDAGFSDNEIAYLIIMFRTKHGGLEKIKREKYIANTIKFAREKAGMVDVHSDIDNNITELNLKIDQLKVDVCRGEVNDVDETRSILEMLKRNLLDTVSSKFAVDLLEIKKYPFDPDPEYEIITDRGSIYIGKIENIIDFRLFRRRIASSDAGILMNPMKPQVWDKYVQAILNACTTVDSMPSEATEAGNARVWVGEYFYIHKKFAESLFLSVTRGIPFKRRDGKFFIPKDKFIEWLRLSGEKVSDRIIFRKMRRAGFGIVRTSCVPKPGGQPRSCEGFLASESQRASCIRNTRGGQDDLPDETDREGGEDLWAGERDGDELHESGGSGAGFKGYEYTPGDDRHAACSLLPDVGEPDDSGDEG